MPSDNSSLETRHPELSSVWYLAASKPRQETRAIENLHNQGITAYSPLISVEKIRSNKKVIVEEAMFPGYIFIKLSPQSGLWHKVKSTRGVRDWVRFSGKAASLPEKLVDNLIKQEQQQTLPTLNKCPSPGDRVKILSGPFQGLNGIYQASSGEERAIILIDFLGKVNRLKLNNVQITSN